jgi:hypothetical protein
MDSHGYVSCGGGEGGASTAAMLSKRSSRWPLRRQRLEQLVSAGYEGAGDDDERWVRYYLDRHVLDVSDSYAVGTTQVMTRHELDARLRTVATHIAAQGLGD